MTAARTTFPRPAARRELGRGLLGLAGLLIAGAAFADDEPPRPDPLPLESEGELRFSVDLSGYRGAGGSVEQEVYLSITNDQLEFQAREDGLHEGKLRMSVLFRNPQGKEIFSEKSELRPQAGTELDARDRGILQVIREDTVVEPGLIHVEVTLVDERSQKPGLVNRMRNKKKQGRAAGWVQVESFESDELTVSDLTLVRSARAAAEGSSFGRNGVDFDANPSHLYGLALASVCSYLEVYGGASYEEGDSFLVRTRILDRAAETVAEKTSRALPQSSAFVVTDQLPLVPARIEAGAYTLEVMVMCERTRESVTAQRPFEVIWGIASWSREPAALVQEMRLIMTDSELKTLERLSAGAREIYLAEYWRELDPSPETAENESLREFQIRVAKADHEFGATLQRGILTDRGRVYVRYGPPDEVTWQYSSSNFGMDEASQRVATPGERAGLSARPSSSFLEADEFREGDVSDVANQRGGANIESKQLEIWEYNGHGNVLNHRQDLGLKSHRGLKFIFADEIGDGNFELIGSSGASVY